MAKVKLPANVRQISTPNGKYSADKDGLVDVPDKDLTNVLKAGAVTVGDYGTTAARPTTNLHTGQTYFDTTLNKPIWRNAANTGWVDATGAGV